LAIVLQTTQWPKEKDRRTDNTMAKRKRQKNRQHNGQMKKTEEQTTQWPNEKVQTRSVCDCCLTPNSNFSDISWREQDTL
jgi:ribosomal protein L44E